MHSVMHWLMVSLAWSAPERVFPCHVWMLFHNKNYTSIGNKCGVKPDCSQISPEQRESHGAHRHVHHSEVSFPTRRKLCLHCHALEHSYMLEQVNSADMQFSLMQPCALQVGAYASRSQHVTIALSVASVRLLASQSRREDGSLLCIMCCPTLSDCCSRVQACHSHEAKCQNFTQVLELSSMTPNALATACRIGMMARFHTTPCRRTGTQS